MKKNLINEEFGGGDFGGPYGLDFTGGDHSKLTKVFVGPFTDVFKTAAGKGKEVSTKMQTLGKVAIEAVATTFIPQLSSDFKEIFDKEHEQLGKLRNQYRDVYDRTWTAIKDNDVLAAAFAYAPAQMITSAAARKAPGPVLDVVNIMAGGKLDGFVSKIKKKLKLGGEQKILSSDSGPGPMEARVVHGKFIITEKSDGKFDVGKALSQDKVKKIIQANPTVRNMEQASRSIVKQGLETMFDNLSSLASSKSVQELEQKLGKKFGLEKQLQNVPEGERKQFEQTLLHTALRGMKDVAIQHLKTVVKASLGGGVPSDHPFVVDHKKAMSKINQI